MPQFIQGLDLNRHFFQQIIKPLIDKNFPDLKYSAGILGEGSDVLRFDTPLSTDHNWGPHLRIFLPEKDFEAQSKALDKLFKEELPYEFMGYSTNFTEPKLTYLVQQMKPIHSGQVNHLIQFYTIRSFFEHYIGFNPYRKISVRDWLTFPQQALIEVTSGEIYYDELGLQKVRDKFCYYPEQVWIYMYTMQWGYIGAEEAFMGRAGEVGDELGSYIIATHLVTNIMKLCFMMEKRYIPYIKWFGSAFSRLKCAAELTHILIDVLHGKTWAEREDYLGRAYEIIARMHNELHLTPTIKTQVSEFEGRPYKVLHANDVFREMEKLIKDPYLKDMKYQLGAVDQFISHPKINHMNYVYIELKRIIK